MIAKLKKDMQKLADPKRAKLLQGFFKTGKGEYGEGDLFLGLYVGDVRKVAKKYVDLTYNDIEKLLYNKFHEIRLAALLILVERFKKNKEEREKIVKFYLKHAKGVNNWDLVDLTAHKILGAWLVDKDRKILYKLAKSKNLWEKRISMIATFAFLPNNDFKDILKLAEFHLKDDHDLMHKAVGWVLREMGKKDQKLLEKFLKKHYDKLPRTTLRYAIERFEEKKRKRFLLGKV